MSTAKDVDVKVWDTLTRGVASIDHNSIAALGNAHLIGDFRRRVEQMSHKGQI